MKIKLNTEKHKLRLKGDIDGNDIFKAFDMMLATIHYVLETREETEENRKQIALDLNNRIDIAVLGKPSNETINKKFDSIFYK